MSIEKKIDQCLTLFKDILIELAKPTGKSGSTSTTTAAAPPRGRGRPPKAPPADDLGDDSEELDSDDLGDGDDDLGEEEEPAYDFKTVRTAVVKIRDHGGEKANADDVKRIMTKFSLKNFNELQEADQSTLNEVMAFVQQIAAKKKIRI